MTDFSERMRITGKSLHIFSNSTAQPAHQQGNASPADAPRATT
jgi:hypothetical protein